MFHRQAIPGSHGLAISGNVFDVPTPGGGPLEFLEKLAPAKTRGIGLLYGENCIYLPSAVFD